RAGRLPAGAHGSERRDYPAVAGDARSADRLHRVRAGAERAGRGAGPRAARAAGGRLPHVGVVAAGARAGHLPDGRAEPAAGGLRGLYRAAGCGRQPRADARRAGCGARRAVERDTVSELIILVEIRTRRNEATNELAIPDHRPGDPRYFWRGGLLLPHPAPAARVQEAA